MYVRLVHSVLERCTVCSGGVMCAKVVYCVLRQCTM